MNLQQKHTRTIYKYTDGILPEKLSLDIAKKILGDNSISDEKVDMLVDELYKLSIITFKMFNKKGG